MNNMLKDDAQAQARPAMVLARPLRLAEDRLPITMAGFDKHKANFQFLLSSDVWYVSQKSSECMLHFAIQGPTWGCTAQFVFRHQIMSFAALRARRNPLTTRTRPLPDSPDASLHLLCIRAHLERDDRGLCTPDTRYPIDGAPRKGSRRGRRGQAFFAHVHMHIYTVRGLH